MKNSVCIATYNGEKYIEKQLKSILDQLSDDDEIIIVDDCSSDNTVNIVRKFQDERIYIECNSINIGVNKTFEKAIAMAQGNIIFLSDQDDIWFKNKVKVILELFKKNDVSIIQHDAEIVDDNMNILHKSFFKLRNAGSGIIKNFISNTYLGCSMAIKKEALKKCLPIPQQKGYHDRWIGVIAEINGYTSLFVQDILMYYIRHEGTGSNLNRRKILTIVFDRLDFFRAIVVFYLKKNFFKG